MIAVVRGEILDVMMGVMDCGMLVRILGHHDYGVRSQAGGDVGVGRRTCTIAFIILRFELLTHSHV